MNSVERPQMSQSILKAAAGIAALAAIAFGASAIASSDKSATASVAGGPPGAAAGNGGGPGQGFPPQGGPGFGTPVTGATAAKVKAAALARYPGTIERIVALPDGNYVAHVFRSGGSEVHVIVNKQFDVTGTEAGRPRGGPPTGSTPSTGSGGSGTSS
jgi:hypothetical protein